MDAQDQLAIAQLGVSLALLVVAVSVMHRRTRVDCFRERLFTLRDELFDFMWQNNVDFDLPAYRLVRTVLNNVICVASSITPMTLLVVLLVVKRQAAHESMCSKAIKAIENPATRARFQQTVNDFAEASLEFMRPIKVVLWSIAKLQRLRRAVRPQVYQDVIIHDLVTFGRKEALVRPFFMGRRSSLTSRL